MRKIFALALLLAPTLAAAQLTPQAGKYVDADGRVHNREVIEGPREFFQLVSANNPSAAVTVFGGDYILAQTCTGYGTVNLVVLGPDGTSFTTVLSKTGVDGNGGTGLSLGSYAQVRVTVSGTTGCYVTLSRVPS